MSIHLSVYRRSTGLSIVSVHASAPPSHRPGGLDVVQTLEVDLSAARDWRGGLEMAVAAVLDDEQLRRTY